MAPRPDVFIIPLDCTPLEEAVGKIALKWFSEDLKALEPNPEDLRRLEILKAEEQVADRLDGARTQNAGREPGISLADNAAKIEKTLRARDRRIDNILSKTWARLLPCLYAERMRTEIITADGGRHKISATYWGSQNGIRSYVTHYTTNLEQRFPWKLRFPTGWGHSTTGRPLVRKDDLAAFLGRGPAPEAGQPQNGDTPLPSKGVGGVPRQFDPEVLLVEAARILYIDGLVPASQAELRRAALDAYAATLPANKEPPSDEWAEAIIRKLWNRLELGSKR